MEQRNIIYRVAVSGLHCKSSVELVNIKIMAVEGVEAASVGPDHVLTVFADADSVSPSDIVRALVDVGVLPDGELSTSLVASETEEVLTAAPEAIAFAPVETTDEPARGAVAASCTAHMLSERAGGPVASASALGAPLAADAHTAVEESIRADLETPNVAASPRASLVQRIKVVVSDDYYPNRIEVIPGVPVDIEFSEGHGCLARVVFEEFDIDQDLTSGGATVRLPGLTPGTHEFTCGMRMVYGTVVAEI